MAKMKITEVGRYNMGWIEPWRVPHPTEANPYISDRYWNFFGLEKGELRGFYVKVSLEGLSQPTKYKTINLNPAFEFTAGDFSSKYDVKVWCYVYAAEADFCDSNGRPKSYTTLEAERKWIAYNGQNVDFKSGHQYTKQQFDITINNPTQNSYYLVLKVDREDTTYKGWLPIVYAGRDAVNYTGWSYSSVLGDYTVTLKSAFYPNEQLVTELAYNTSYKLPIYPLGHGAPYSEVLRWRDVNTQKEYSAGSTQTFNSSVVLEEVPGNIEKATVSTDNIYIIKEGSQIRDNKEEYGLESVCVVAPAEFINQRYGEQIRFTLTPTASEYFEFENPGTSSYGDFQITYNSDKSITYTGPLKTTNIILKEHILIAKKRIAQIKDTDTDREIIAYGNKAFPPEIELTQLQISHIFKSATESSSVNITQTSTVQLNGKFDSARNEYSLFATAEPIILNGISKLSGSNSVGVASLTKPIMFDYEFNEDTGTLALDNFRVDNTQGPLMVTMQGIITDSYNWSSSFTYGQSICINGEFYNIDADNNIIGDVTPSITNTEWSFYKDCPFTQLEWEVKSGEPFPPFPIHFEQPVLNLYPINEAPAYYYWYIDPNPRDDDGDNSEWRLISDKKEKEG